MPRRAESPLAAAASRALTLARFVRIEHTLFSLPLLLGGAWLQAGGWPGIAAVVAVIVGGAGARTAALSLNRIIDREIDAANPRTAARELPAGRLSVREAALLAGAGATVLAAVGFALGGLPRLLWPVPLAVFTVYPYMKRFTAWCHGGVGLSLAMGPLAGALATTPTRWPCGAAWTLALFALFWVSGFDVIYARFDEQFDRRAGLRSAVVALGSKQAMRLAAALHLGAVLVLAALVFGSRRGPVGIGGLVVTGALLSLEQRLGTATERRLFDLNAAVGFAALAAVIG